MSVISFEEYEKKFQQLLNDTVSTEEEFKSQIQDLIYQAPSNFQELSLPFVVRTSLLELSETCTNITRCTYNPNVDKIRLQRCNYARQQVFYASVPGGMKHLSDAAMPSILETTFQRIKDDPSFD